MARELTPEQYRVFRQKGTERAFTGELWDEHRGHLPLRRLRQPSCSAPDAKFESGTGWPSFCAPADPDTVATEIDRSCS